MTHYKQGDIVLVDFNYTDAKGSKKRPALVISSDEYNKKREEIIIAAITSNVERILIGDTLVKKWKEAGLLFASTVTGIIRTVKSSLVLHKLGSIHAADLPAVSKNFKRVLDI